MEILSHRYLTEGKNKPSENTVSQLQLALADFSFFETDIRRLVSGEFYISHDPQNTLTFQNDARKHAELWRGDPNIKIALNIKELGYEKDLLDFLKTENVLGQIFLFDYELLGAEPQKFVNNIQKLEPTVKLAARVSDRNEPIDRALSIKGADIIWLDEFDSLWVRQGDIEQLKAAGKVVYCIAPDLHDFSEEDMKKRFSDFTAWGADGICTDYALLLRDFLASLGHD